MEIIAKICPKCGTKGLVPITSIYCFCGVEMITFKLTKDEYVAMSDEEIESMIQDMGIHPKIDTEDAWAIYQVTKSPEVIDAMIELKEKDIIEYSLKASQFRIQRDVEFKLQRENNAVRCPRCGSTDIQAVSAGYSPLYGYTNLGESVNYCKKCGHKWTPRG